MKTSRRSRAIPIIGLVVWIVSVAGFSALWLQVISNLGIYRADHAARVAAGEIPPPAEDYDQTFHAMSTFAFVAWLAFIAIALFITAVIVREIIRCKTD